MNNSSERIVATRIPEPKLQFYNGTHISPRKILDLKPFSYKKLLDEEIHIKILTDTETEYLCKKLVNHLINGYSTLNASFPSFREVFGGKLLFEENSDIKISSSKNLLVDLEESLDALRSSRSRGIVIVGLKALSMDNYIRAKIKVMEGYSSLNIRSQFIKKETIEKHVRSGSYAYLLMNMATAIYAKAGGIPWKLSRSILSTNGLILGISFSRKRIPSGKEVIYYGAIELFDKYGEHLFTQIKMFTAHPEQLKTKGLFVPYEILKPILTNAIKQYGKPPQIIIHKSSPFADEEIKAIEEVTTAHNALYIFAHIKSNTVYRAYDPLASDFSIQRGLMLLRLFRSSRWPQYIIFTTGKLYRSAEERGKLGTPRPLEVTIDINTDVSTNVFTWSNYIGHQILALTKLDWNTTDPEIREPITIKYSRKAAQIAPEILNQDSRDYIVRDIRDLM